MIGTFFRVSAGLLEDILKTETGKFCAEQQCGEQYQAYQQAAQESATRGYEHAQQASQDFLRTETGKLCAEQCQQQYATYQQAVQESMTRGYLHAEPASQDFVNCFVNCRVGLLGLR
ncbi:hypothetical protein T05_15915 [Trichinella murrelli]|uniref:Uncharacterized protein n=1 Tax=Trichinella murrelli TaxID=144512 RepID=A0A0V0THH0_9BILA|nr:hypothetical protein T05_15915 [Trichinella murrelli]